MNLRPEHFAAFAGAGRREFVRRLVSFLKQQYPDAAAASDDELSPPVGRLIDCAESYGLDTEQDMAVYAIAGFLLGETFDIDFPAVQQVLPSPVLSSAEKAEWLAEWTGEVFRSLGG